MLQLRGRRERTERHDHAARERGSERGGEVLRPVRHQDADAAVLAYTARDERARHLDRALPQGRVGPALDAALRAADQRLALGEAIRDLPEVPGDGERSEPGLLAERRTADDGAQCGSSTSRVASTRTPPSWLVSFTLTVTVGIPNADSGFLAATSASTYVTSPSKAGARNCDFE